MLGLAAADLVDKHRFRAPDRGRGLKEPDAGAVLVRVREADEIVEGDEARVVVPVLESQRLGERVEQEGFPGPRGTDEEQWIPGDQSRQDQRLEGIEPEYPETGKTREPVRGCLGRPPSEKLY